MRKENKIMKHISCARVIDAIAADFVLQNADSKPQAQLGTWKQVLMRWNEGICSFPNKLTDNSIWVRTLI